MTVTLPDIDFRRIRPHNGSRDGGFEELCCQLAALDVESAAGTFIRKGLGADAGVECFHRQTSGREVGWQAKYFVKLGAPQVTQLDDSIATAIKRHPALTRYIVCLPIDLRDQRRGKTRSELDRWQAWLAKWKRRTRRGRRYGAVRIELWNRSRLVAQLTKTDPQSAGRLLYWFDELLFTPAWFRQKFEHARLTLAACRT